MEVETLKAIFRHAPHLVELECVDCSIPPDMLAKIDFSQGTDITFYNSDLSSFDTSFFLSWKKVRNLRVFGCNLKDASCDGFDQLPNLRLVEIGERNTDINTVLNLSQCHHLVWLKIDLHNCKEINLDLLASMRNLYHLTICGNGTSITSFALLSAQGVDFSDCNFVTPIISTLVESKISYVKFTRCKQLNRHTELVVPASLGGKDIRLIFDGTEIDFWDTVNLILGFDGYHQIYIDDKSDWRQIMAKYALMLSYEVKFFLSPPIEIQ